MGEFSCCHKVTHITIREMNFGYGDKEDFIKLIVSDIQNSERDEILTDCIKDNFKAAFFNGYHKKRVYASTIVISNLKSSNC